VNSTVIEAIIPEKAMFRPDEVAKLLGTSKRTIYRYHGEGKIEGIKIAGQTLRFTRNAIISILKESE